MCFGAFNVKAYKNYYPSESFFFYQTLEHRKTKYRVEYSTITIFTCVYSYLPSILARGVTPSLLAAVAVISTRAQAPSFSVLALAAVTVPTETNYFYIINNYKMCASVLVNILKCCCSTPFLNIPYNHR